MNGPVNPDPRLAPLPADANPDLKDSFENSLRHLGFIPNSMLIMQRKPKLVKAFSQLSAAVWEYRTSPLNTEAERVALDFAIAAASQPNAVTDELFAEMERHWSANQIVEIAAVVALFGFLNRFNDTMATPLEAEPTEVGEKFLASHGWSVGRHRR